MNAPGGDVLGIPRGLVHGLANAEYHALPALGSSGLKRLARSPAHFYATTLDPQRPASEPTLAMRAGTLAHCAVLEPDELAARYIVRPAGIDGRTKEGKAWLEAVPRGVDVVTADQMLTAQRQAAAVRALPDIGALLDNGHAEVSAFAVDAPTGVLLKARPDWVSPAGDGGRCVILDVKTTTSAVPKDFARSCVNFGYAQQCVHYSTVYQQASKEEVLGFVFVCVEADYPHAAAAFMLGDEWLEMAQRQRRELIDLYARCLREDHWPGYSEAIELLEMPRWLAYA